MFTGVPGFCFTFNSRNIMVEGQSIQGETVGIWKPQRKNPQICRQEEPNENQRRPRCWGYRSKPTTTDGAPAVNSLTHSTANRALGQVPNREVLYGPPPALTSGLFGPWEPHRTGLERLLVAGESWFSRTSCMGFLVFLRCFVFCCSFRVIFVTIQEAFILECLSSVCPKASACGLFESSEGSERYFRSRKKMSLELPKKPKT